MIESNPQNATHRVAEPGRLAASPADALATSRARGILIVDDQACIRDVLSIGLRQAGFSVWLAANGREAFDLYRCRRAVIDVVLLDIHMPELDGPQTLARLQELDPQIRCCFLSADFDSCMEEELRNLGAAAVLQKPIPLGDLAQVLRQLAKRGRFDLCEPVSPPRSFVEWAEEPMEAIKP